MFYKHLFDFANKYYMLFADKYFIENKKECNIILHYISYNILKTYRKTQVEESYY